MEYPMNYPNTVDLKELNSMLNEFARLKYEESADRNEIERIVSEAEEALRGYVKKLEALPVDPVLASKEPDDLAGIKALRPGGSRVLWKGFNSEKYAEKLEGALLSRFAGCILGASVEQWSIKDMQIWADYIGDKFPPVDYWSAVKDPVFKRYMTASTEAAASSCEGGCKSYKYARDGMDCVPLDDDIVYTLLNLLIIEDYGPNFTTENVGKGWLKYFPYLCYVHTPSLRNLKAGIPASQTAVVDNPRVQQIAADIRADPWGYVAPGLPELAAEFAYRDAYSSHRRNGIYGEMFFSAAIAAAFEVDNAVDALKIGLNEVPRDSLFSRDIRWALEEGKNLKNYEDARNAVEQRFDKMSLWHTNLNACLTVFGLMIGGDDITKVLGETVAMGCDNDCTAATAGSIIGAIKGRSGVPEHWYKNFNNRILSFLTGHPEFKFDDVVGRFTAQAGRVFKNL